MRKLAFGLAAIALAAFAAGALVASKREPGEIMASLPELPTLKPFAGEREIAPFSLTDHHGQVFDRERLRGRWTLMTFGFTSCPDACPTMLTNLVELRKSLPADWHGPEPQFVLVSVDPARDTQAVLAQYVPAFDHAFLGVTGSQVAIDRMHAEFGGVHRIAPRKPAPADAAANDQYSVDHSVLLYVINPDGRLHAQIAPPFDPAGVAGQIGRFAQAFLATKAAVSAASQQGVR